MKTSFTRWFLDLNLDGIDLRSIAEWRACIISSDCYRLTGRLRWHRCNFNFVVSVVISCYTNYISLYQLSAMSVGSVGLHTRHLIEIHILAWKIHANWKEIIDTTIYNNRSPMWAIMISGSIVGMILGMIDRPPLALSYSSR